MSWRHWLPLAVLALLIGFLALGLMKDPRKLPSPLLGKPAPSFDLPTLEDPSRRFSTRQLQGEVCLVNVWASWCASCRDEHPLLMALARDQDIPVYGLNYKDEREAALAWLAQFGNPYRSSLYDAEGRAGLDWGVYGVPETFVLDKQGRIRHKHVGALTAEDLKNKLLPLVQALRQEGA